MRLPGISANTSIQMDHGAGEEVGTDRRGNHQKHGNQQFVQAEPGLKRAEMQH